MPDQANPLGPPVTVHGIVKNAFSGEPLPRALVLVDGQAGMGALTDGDGRFEIQGVTLGPNIFQITKPGFEDAAGAANSTTMRDLRGYTHNVVVTEETPELVFSMRPTNSIRGHIDLSTGDPAQNNPVTLLAREIVNGRAVWRPQGSTRANADGSYHFAHLSDGDYALAAEPTPDSDITAGLPAADPTREIASNWYPQTYYPDAHDFSGAAHIHLAGGEQAQANLTLPLETFHAVHATLLLPPGMGAPGEGAGVSLEVTTPEGYHLPYPVSYNKNNSAQALLPDGTYSLRATANQPQILSVSNSRSFRGVSFRRTPSLTGQIDFTVAGHALNRLRIPVAAQTPTPLQIDINHTGTQAQTSNPNRGQVFVEISQAGPLTDGMNTMFAQGSGLGQVDTNPPSPGRYWVHTVIAEQGVCESSFTAGGASLAREPLTVGPAGVTAQLTLTLRDDCASLKLSLPSSVAGMAAGEETAYTVFVVPDFDFTTDARSITLRASTGGTFTFNSLTPGSYHVYTFSTPVDLEYHNRDALAAVPGQSVTLAPNATQDLTLEVPAQ